MIGSSELLRGGGDNSIHISSIANNISVEDIFSAWRAFKKGKMNKRDVLLFAVNAEEHLHNLWNDIYMKRYNHGKYTTFEIADPKLRTINKATVRDRVIHHLIHMKLESVFEKGFIGDSYSSRKGKGVHKALERFEYFAQHIACSNKKSVWTMKVDVRRFFDSVDHEILFVRISEKVFDEELLWLIREVLDSFQITKGKGLPLGNLTSQLFANVYLDICDQYIKRGLGVKYYIRYADDMIFLSGNKGDLEQYLQQLDVFLATVLKVSLHPEKIIIRTWRQGVDILGYISYPYHKEIRTKTKRRIRHNLKITNLLLREQKISEEKCNQIIASYRGRITHCWSNRLKIFLNLN